MSESGGPEQRLWTQVDPRRFHVRIRGEGGHDTVARFLGTVGAHPGRGINIEADKINGGGDRLHHFGCKLRRVGTHAFQEALSIFPRHHDVKELCVLLLISSMGSRDVLGSGENRANSLSIFGEAYLDSLFGIRTNRLDSQSVTPD